MARVRDIDPWPHITAVAQALAQPGQPRGLFAALDRAMVATLGHRACSPSCATTRMLRSPSGSTRTRAPRTRWAAEGRPAPPPVHRRASSASGGRTSDGRRRTSAPRSATRKPSFSLGCESVLNLPVIFDGRVLGTVNMLHEAGWYDELIRRSG